MYVRSLPFTLILITISGLCLVFVMQFTNSGIYMHKLFKKSSANLNDNGANVNYMEALSNQKLVRSGETKSNYEQVLSSLLTEKSNNNSIKENLLIEILKHAVRAETYLEEIANKINKEKKYTLGSLPEGDFTRLNNLKNFQFVIFNTVCDSSTFILALVPSAPDHVDLRQAIRATWGSKKYAPTMRLLFLLGAVTLEQQQKLENENLAHADILQGNFIDAYRNMTYKHVMALKYASYYCPQAKFILKSDDDAFVRTPLLVRYLQKRYKLCSSENYLQCTVQVNRSNTVHRGETNKWKVTYEEYPGNLYPNFCPGSRPIVFSADVALKFYTESQRGDFFWLDDVYITGIIANRLKLLHKPFNEVTLKQGQDIDIINNNNVHFSFMNKFLFAIYMNPKTMRDLWNVSSKFNLEESLKFIYTGC